MTKAPATTSKVEIRLHELGLRLPEMAAPVAAYVPAIISGDHIYTSGQLPLVNGALTATGKVGAAISRDEARQQAATCAINALAAIKAHIGDLDRITQIVKVTGYVASDPDFTEQPAVINGASELLSQIFEDSIGTHARSAVGVTALPLGASVEVEITARFA
ncbi:RidA family protein [Arthrobacter sp. B2a2-09]|uniref:RidA family protein n=1 Tax=Arthrobacter sp. B2a2-09 TaxID=2952822 RepID=UPI0022CD9BD9|nr:RidA family protein [Arthrobacter sp. B2a2-09]MCZ9883177.1 RidA family protein [Arthrobacter sp. B2a2-09]